MLMELQKFRDKLDAVMHRCMDKLLFMDMVIQEDFWLGMQSIIIA